MPVIPNILGNISSNIVINTNVRKNDNIADNFPFDNAVNTAEVKIFHPQNKKLNEKIKNPFIVIL